MRNQFTFYKSFDDVIEDMTNSQIAEYVKVMLDVQFLRVKIDDVKFTDKTLSIVWKSQKHSIQTSIKGYLDSQKRDSVKNPYLGIYDESCTPYEGVPQQDKEQVKEEGKVQKSIGFKKPSILEVQEYIQEKSYKVNANTFFNFYESNGWKVGKNKMKSWKASLATWNSKENNNIVKNNETSGRSSGGYTY